ncbi:MAG: hypothetical protein LBC65_03140, partial [Oscillospiraceae bacterium]|nr:hypothetical protein [Oscillospiraceae bacterium]
TFSLLVVVVAVFVTRLIAANAVGTVSITLLPISPVSGSGIAVNVNEIETGLTLQNGVATIVPNVPEGEVVIQHFETAIGFIRENGTYSGQYGTITAQTGDSPIPVFFGVEGDTSRCVALYSEVGATLTLDLLTKPGCASVSGGSASENTLTLAAGELAIVKVPGDLATFTLSGKQYSISPQGAYIAVDDEEFEPELPPEPPIGAAVDKFELELALDRAEPFINGGNGDGRYDTQSWTAFESAYNAAELVLANADATAAMVSDATAMLRDAALNLTKAASTVKSPTIIPNNANAKIMPPANSVLTRGSTVLFKVLLTDKPSIANLSMKFEFNPDVLDFEYAETASPFTVLTASESGGTATVTAGQMSSDYVSLLGAFASDESEDSVLYLRFRVLDGSTADSATVTLKSATIAVIAAVGDGADAKCEITTAAASITITDGISDYAPNLDLNNDNVLSLADIATLQSWYRVTSSDALWSSAKPADWDSDNVITIKDCLLLLAAFESKGIDTSDDGAD